MYILNANEVVNRKKRSFKLKFDEKIKWLRPCVV